MMHEDVRLLESISGRVEFGWVGTGFAEDCSVVMLGMVGGICWRALVVRVVREVVVGAFRLMMWCCERKVEFE